MRNQMYTSLLHKLPLPVRNLNNKLASVAGSALSSLKQSERHPLANLFRNAHAIIKKQQTFQRLCGAMTSIIGMPNSEMPSHDQLIAPFPKRILR